MRNERGEVRTDITEIQKFMKEYYKVIYQQFGKSRKNGKNSKNTQPAKPKSRGIVNWNRPIISSEIEFVIKNFHQTMVQQTMVQDQTASLVNSMKHIQKNKYLPFSNYSQKTEEKGTLPNSF